MFQEPKLTSEVDAVLAEYAEAVEKRPVRALAFVEPTLLPTAAVDQGGGLLLSVVGAKLSEGINCESRAFTSRTKVLSRPAFSLERPVPSGGRDRHPVPERQLARAQGKDALRRQPTQRFRRRPTAM